MPAEPDIDFSNLASAAYKHYTNAIVSSFESHVDFITNLSFVSWADFFITFLCSFLLLYKAIDYFKKEMNYQDYIKRKQHAE